MAGSGSTVFVMNLAIIHSISYDDAVRAMKSIFSKVKRCCKSSRVHSSTGEKFPGQCSVVLPPPIFSSCPYSEQVSNIQCETSANVQSF